MSSKKAVPTTSLHSFWHAIVVVVQSLSHIQLSVTPRTAARQASLSFPISLSLFKVRSIESMMPSNRLCLCLASLVNSRWKQSPETRGLGSLLVDPCHFSFTCHFIYPSIHPCIHPCTHGSNAPVSLPIRPSLLNPSHVRRAALGTGRTDVESTVSALKELTVWWGSRKTKQMIPVRRVSLSEG